MENQMAPRAGSVTSPGGRSRISADFGNFTPCWYSSTKTYWTTSSDQFYCSTRHIVFEHITGLQVFGHTLSSFVIPQPWSRGSVFDVSGTGQQFPLKLFCQMCRCKTEPVLAIPHLSRLYANEFVRSQWDPRDLTAMRGTTEDLSK